MSQNEGHADHVVFRMAMRALCTLHLVNPAAARVASLPLQAKLEKYLEEFQFPPPWSTNNGCLSCRQIAPNELAALLTQAGTGRSSPSTDDDDDDDLLGGSTAEAMKELDDLLSRTQPKPPTARCPESPVLTGSHNCPDQDVIPATRPDSPVPVTEDRELPSAAPIVAKPILLTKHSGKPLCSHYVKKPRLNDADPVVLDD